MRVRALCTARRGAPRWDPSPEASWAPPPVFGAPATAEPAGGDFERFLTRAVDFESKRASEPESFDNNLGAASNLNFAMAIPTNGYITLFDGLQDSDDHRAVWSEYGEHALKHARTALRLGHKWPSAANGDR